MGLSSTHIFVAVLLAGAFAFPDLVIADDVPTATAPPEHAIVQYTPTGNIYAPNGLVKKRNALKRKVAELRKLLFVDPSDDERRQELADVRSDLASLAKEIDEHSVLVEPMTVFRRRVTESFDLSESGQLVITSDDVILRGWNGKNIKCVIEKAVLGIEEPDDSEFEAIKVQHESRIAQDLVGETEEQYAARYAKEFSEKEPKKYSEQAIRNRKELFAQIRASYANYKPLQGNVVNVLKVTGLTFQEGNEHLSVKTESPGGSSSQGGQWKRSAKVTIYIPKCQHVLVRGCTKSVDIKSVDANLILTDAGSHDIDYNGSFAIVNNNGDVMINQVPIRVVRDVNGSVRIVQTDEMTNTGTAHDGNSRTKGSPAPDPVTISGVTKNLSGHFVRADLSVSNIEGQIDLVNEYGNTSMTIAKPLAKQTHRVVSHSGAIYAEIDLQAEGDKYTVGVPVYAYTQSGSVRMVKFNREQFQDRSFSAARRSWYGFQSIKEDFGLGFVTRQTKAWKNEKRSDGLDLVSNAGQIVITPIKK